MPWKTMDVQEQRVRFVQKSPRRTEGAEEQRVLELRRRYPDWGARKLRVLLQREGIELARNTIHRILLRHDLIAAEDRHPPAVERFERSAANELWQMDFKGPKLWYRKVGPLSVIDDHSRYLIVLRAVQSTHTEQVREPLRDAFCAHGVPEAMLMDHGTPWWSVQSTGGMTKLSLWLMQQGIALHWSRVRHPQTQGKVERFHGELQRALARRRTWMEDAQSCWTSFAGNIIMCGRTRRWRCKPRPVAGVRACGATIPTRRDGNIPQAQKC